MCEPASARLSLQAMRLTLKQRFYPLIAEKYNVASHLAYQSYFTNKSVCAVCSLRDLSDICVQ